MGWFEALVQVYEWECARAVSAPQMAEAEAHYGGVAVAGLPWG